ncbi:MAG: hypothetical protein ABIQ36_05625 [Rhodanobacter sp.]
MGDVDDVAVAGWLIRCIRLCWLVRDSRHPVDGGAVAGLRTCARRNAGS